LTTFLLPVSGELKVVRDMSQNSGAAN